MSERDQQSHWSAGEDHCRKPVPDKTSSLRTSLCTAGTLCHFTGKSFSIKIYLILFAYEHRRKRRCRGLSDNKVLHLKGTTKPICLSKVFRYVHYPAVNADLKNDIELDEVVNLEKTKQNYSRSRSNSISQKIGLHFVGLCILRIPMASNLESWILTRCYQLTWHVNYFNKFWYHIKKSYS